MAKTNDKKKRIRGITPSSNTELPNPLNSFNSPLGSLNNKSKETIQQQNGKQNSLFQLAPQSEKQVQNNLTILYLLF